MPILALQSPVKGVKLVLETIYFEGWCTSKEVEKVLKVKLKFRGSKSGRPTDDLLSSSGRPTAILGVRTPGRPLNMHAGLYPRIIVSKSHENTSKYVDTVTFLQKLEAKVIDP